MAPPIAYLARGKLHVQTGAGPARVVESAFADAVRERAREIHQRQSWKSEGRGARFMSGGLLWGMPNQDPAQMRIAVTSVTRGAVPGDLLYALETDGLGGICSWSAADGIERRLLHGSERQLRHLATGTERIACAVGHKDGSASIGVMQADATDLTEVTEGDAQDLAPSWVPGAGRRLVYQTAGIGRDREGHPTGLGPFAIHELDLDRGEVRTLASDPDADLLGPRMDEAGALYYIRRPYARPQGFAPLRMALDILLLPFRLLYAVFQYLNFFSARYTGKPLTTAGGPKRQGADIRQMMIWGNLIDAEATARENAGDGEPPAVVPRTWKLMRQRPDGRAEIVAQSVLSFDLCRDGSLVHSTGSAVYHVDGAGRVARLCEDGGIEQVIALD